MQRREFLRQSAAAGSTILAAGIASAPAAQSPAVPAFHPRRFELADLTVAELQKGLASGKYSSTNLVRLYLRRIQELDRDPNGPRLKSVLEVNPDAAQIAASLDRERHERKPRGPLHGIPVLIKDNIDTHDKMTATAGSLALEGSRPAVDAFLVRQLRTAGAVILGKTNLSEWANFRGNRSISGWSGRGGLCRNPHALDRSTSGSSAGSAAAVAASLCAVAVGTETDGSIVSPSSYCGVVGIKPTVGLVSRSGIIPISSSQDTAGPMGRTVADAAALLSGMVGVDPQDSATAESSSHIEPDYTRFLDSKALRGARIGVARNFWGWHPRIDRLMESVLETLRREGAILTDPAPLPSRQGLGDAEFTVMLYEFKAGLNAYLGGLDPAVKIRSIPDLIEFNERHRERELPFFGQETLIAAAAAGTLTDAKYLEARAKCRQWARTDGIDALMDKHQLDAILAPTTNPAHTLDLINGDRGLGGSSTYAAVAGYPSITLPAGEIFGLPLGLSLFGRAWSEPRLIALAHAFETATPHARRAPRFLATAAIDA